MDLGRKFRAWKGNKMLLPNEIGGYVIDDLSKEFQVDVMEYSNKKDKNSMNTTYKSLKVRKGGIKGESSWKTQQAELLKAHELERKSRISPESAKEKADRESAEKLESMQLFSDSDLAELESMMMETPRLQINKAEYVRILSQGALNTEY